MFLYDFILFCLFLYCFYINFVQEWRDYVPAWRVDDERGGLGRYEQLCEQHLGGNAAATDREL